MGVILQSRTQFKKFCIGIFLKTEFCRPSYYQGPLIFRYTHKAIYCLSSTLL